MADFSSYKPYLYLEGFRTRIMRVQCTTGVGMPARASITIPGSKWGSKIVPGTRVELWLEEEKELGPFLYFTGTVKEYPDRNVGLGSKTIVLDCSSDFASLMEARIQTINIRDSIGIGGQGKWQLLTGRGTIKVPGGVAGTASAAALWKELMKTSPKGKVKGEEKSNDQLDQVATFKGKLLGLIQSLMMMHPMHFEHLRRTQFLDRLGMYIDENATRIFRADAGGKDAAKMQAWLIDAVFQGNKTAWQAINDLAGVMFHDVVSVCPPIKDSHEILERGPMYLPPKKWVQWMMGTTTDVSPTDIKLEDYVTVERTSSSMLDVLIKPDMRGCYPPTCNVVQPNMYEQFRFRRNSGVTRMGMYVPTMGGFGLSVLRPDVLESVYYRSLKYGAKSTKFAPKSDLLNHHANDFVTNEERVLGKIGYTQTNMDPAVAKSYSWAFRNDWEEKKKELERKVNEILDSDVKALLVKMVPAGMTESKASNINTSSKVRNLARDSLIELFKSRGLSGSEATTMAKKYVEKFKDYIDKAATEFRAAAKKLKEAQERYWEGKEGEAKSTFDKWQTEYESLLEAFKLPTQKKLLDDMLSDEPGIDDYITAYRQEANKRFDGLRGGTIEVGGKLNLSAISGFPVMFVDPDGTDIIGYLQGKTDILDWNSGSATTSYTVKNPRDLYDVDFNSPTRQKKFMLNQVGQNQFSWGKTFDYSSMVYQKFLRAKAFVPAMMKNYCGFPTSEANNYLAYMQEDVASNVKPHDRSKLVYLEDGMAHLGLCIKNKNISRMYAERRSVRDLNPNAGDIFLDDSTTAKASDMLPKISTLTGVYAKTSREQFYCVGDVMALMVESDTSDLKKKIELLDSRNGRFGYIFDNFNSDKSVPPVAKEYFEQFAGFVDDPLIKEDLEKASFGELTKFEFESAPRRNGNPGVTFTDLLLSYLSTFETPITANDIHGSGKPANNPDLEKLKSVTSWHKGRYKEAARKLIKNLIDDISEDYITNQQMYFTSDGTPISGLGGMIDKSINAEYQKAETEKKSDEMLEFGKDYNRRKTDVTLKKSEKAFIKEQVLLRVKAMKYTGQPYSSRLSFIAAYQASQAPGHGDKASLADMSTPEIPRPMSDADCVDFRMNIVYNMIEEMEQYARLG